MLFGDRLELHPPQVLSRGPLQEVCGGLTRDTRRALGTLTGEVEGKVARKGTAHDARNPLLGTELVCEWNGAEHRVTVLHDGYELAGKKFKSLSAVAKTITGTRWNGFRFCAWWRGEESIMANNGFG